MTNLIFEQTDGEKAQPMSIAKTNEDFNKQQPFPNDPDLGEHTPLVEIPNITDNKFDVSGDNSIYPHSLFIPHNELGIDKVHGSYIPSEMNNKLYDDNIFPEAPETPISNHFISRIGNSNSRNEFSSE
jgi:hypothetical protein